MIGICHADPHRGQQFARPVIARARIAALSPAVRPKWPKRDPETEQIQSVAGKSQRTKNGSRLNGIPISAADGIANGSRFNRRRIQRRGTSGEVDVLNVRRTSAHRKGGEWT